MQRQMPDQVHISWQTICGLGTLTRLKYYAECYLEHGRGDLSMVRNLSRGTEDFNLWYTLKQGSYYLNHVARFLKIYKDCVPGEIQDSNVKKVEETMEYLQFDSAHVTTLLVDSYRQPYTSLSEGSPATSIFHSLGEGCKYYGMLHSKNLSDLVSFLHLVDTKIDPCIEQFRNDVDKLLLEINEVPKHLSVLLIAAIKKKNFVELKCLRNELMVNDNDLSIKEGLTPLHYAVTKNCKDSVLILLPKSSFKTNLNGETPLHTAVAYKYEEIAKILLQNLSETKQIKEILNIRSNKGFTALHVAVLSNSYNLVKDLLERGAIFDVKTNFGETALQLSQDRNISFVLNVIEQLFKNADKGEVTAVSSMLNTIPCNEKPAVMQAQNSDRKSLLAFIAGKASAYKAILKELIELV